MHILFGDLLIAVVAGLLTAVVIYLVHVFRYWLLARRFRVAGEYSSAFQENANSDEFTKSTLTLKQRGRRVWGIDKDSKGREWMLEGQIIGAGHITGVYSATAFHDEGVGSFYLRVGPNQIEGVWCGYANGLKHTASGRYILTKT